MLKAPYNILYHNLVNKVNNMFDKKIILSYIDIFCLLIIFMVYNVKVVFEKPQIKS